MATRFLNVALAIVLGIQMQDDHDIKRLGPVLQDAVDGFITDQPIGIEAHFSTFQPEFASANVNTALTNMAQIFAVVVAVMLLFMCEREALVIASIMPFVVSFSFVLMGPVGVELPEVSIAAINISLGLLVDNGVAIVEDLGRRIRAGEERTDAPLVAGKQYTIPLLIASIITVSAFLPLFLPDGLGGQYRYSLGIVVMLMLTGSFLSAFYLLPRLAVWIIPTPTARKTRRGLFDRLAKGYAQVVHGTFHAPLGSSWSCLEPSWPMHHRCRAWPARSPPVGTCADHGPSRSAPRHGDRRDLSHHLAADGMVGRT
ncbi:efflux RND transporter permease subunit [Rhodobacteraceae bacterium N5(2021)]|uniref:Efflux RND transporter permease subunit n=1 Tax=Gymnodinialimonas phycosphaerae TaxID=2841589 RepID=A0A975TWJ0_9RHOB|nr:efflux RND transporter permease subunit [Gymnodinialimonas phycosphaerae]MBY4891191.1 efflux RND transporter permease subunit [Gymnodinialimonas phycosphaerae]